MIFTSEEEDDETPKKATKNKKRKKAADDSSSDSDSEDEKPKKKGKSLADTNEEGAFVLLLCYCLYCTFFYFLVCGVYVFVVENQRKAKIAKDEERIVKALELRQV